MCLPFAYHIWSGTFVNEFRREKKPCPVSFSSTMRERFIFLHYSDIGFYGCNCIAFDSISIAAEEHIIYRSICTITAEMIKVRHIFSIDFI